MDNKIITVLGSKGGCGQSSVIANLAIGLSRKTQKSVALLDFSEKIVSDIDILLGISETKSFNELFPLINHLDTNLLNGYLKTPYNNLSYLKYGNKHEIVNDTLTDTFTQNFNDTHNTKEYEHIIKIINLLSETHFYILIDLNNNFNNLAIMLLDITNLVLLITTPDILCFNHTKQLLDKFMSLHYPLSLIKIVLNMSTISQGLTKENITAYLNQEIFSEIPYDPETVISSINQGKISVLKSPRSNFSKSILQLCDSLVSQDDIYIKQEQKHMFQQIETINHTDNITIYHPQVIREQFITDSLQVHEPVSNINETEEIIALKNRLHKNLLNELDLKTVDTKSEQKQKELKETTKTILERLLAQEQTQIPLTRDQRTQIINEMLDEVLGLGPLEIFLRDPSVTEIMVVNKDKIYIEQGGKLKLTHAKFNSDEQLMSIIERIVSPIGRRVDESSPLCDARLKDGSRVNIVIPPLALDGPSITIRKFSEKKLTPADLIKFGALTEEMVEFLRICVLLRKNIIISGGTGSGKTTLLNILSSFIPEDERIVTIEDSAELKLQQVHVVRLESRPANIEGEGEIPIRKLVINALRMRPDRIVVGECRGGEALDMLQAMNTGHNGSLTTVHANSPRDALSRIETMVLMAGMELPVRAIREQIKSAINIIVQQTRFSDGSRKVISITEVTGMEIDTITTQDIFKYTQTGISSDGKILGNFEPTGTVPSFIDEIKAKGISLNMKIFQK